MLRQFTLLKLLGIVTGICVTLGILLTPWAAAAMLVAFVGCLVAAGRSAFRWQWSRMWERLVFAAIALVLANLLPATHQEVRRREVCAQCGIIRHTNETKILGMRADRTETFDETELSVWHEQHYGSCGHQSWYYASGSSVGYLDFVAFRWRTVWSVGCARGYPQSLNAADLALLEEQYAQDPAACQWVIGAFLTGRTPLAELISAAVYAPHERGG